MQEERFLPVLKKILQLMEQEEYTALVELDAAKELSAEYIKDAIDDYGGKLTIPNDEIIIRQMEVYETERPNRFYIDLPVWMDHERSDLTLSLVVIKHHLYAEFSLKDIHIM